MALKVALTTLYILRLPCVLAVQSLIPKYFNISITRGCPFNPRCGLTLLNNTLQLLFFPAKSDVKPQFMYLSTKKMLRLAIRIAAAVASFGAFAFATPKPAQPKKPRNRVKSIDIDEQRK